MDLIGIFQAIDFKRFYKVGMAPAISLAQQK
jgi:hypothetical protein